MNTSYAGISCGYGIFPPKYIQNSIENSSIEDWGINGYNTTVLNSRASSVVDVKDINQL